MSEGAYKQDDRVYIDGKAANFMMRALGFDWDENVNGWALSGEVVYQDDVEGALRTYESMKPPTKTGANNE